MRTTIFAAALVAAFPIAAWAQSGQPMRAPNLANPQAEANDQSQPPNVHRDQSNQATSIPTPVLGGNSMTQVPSGSSGTQPRR